MRALIASKAVQEKLRTKHQVEMREVEQCFENRLGEFLEDTREEHRSDPPTYWFVAPTNCDRLLKVVFIFLDGNVHIKTAFDANEAAIRLYDECGR